MIDIDHLQRRLREATQKFEGATTERDKEAARRELLKLKSDCEGLIALDHIKKAHASGQPLRKLGM